jgi:hypothetical protein
MRRLMALLMIFVMLAGMLVACTPEQQLETPPGFDTRPSTEGRLPTTQPTTLPATDPTDPTDPTEPTEPEEQDFFTRYGQGLPEKDQIPTYAEATDTANLYKLPLDLPGPDMIRNIVTYGDTLYISYWITFDGMGGQCGLRVFDLTTGSTRLDIACPEWSDFGPLADGGLWYIAYETMTLELIDSAGQHTTRTLSQAPEGENVGFIYDTCVDPDAGYLVNLYDTDSPVVLYDLNTGDIATPEFADGTVFYTTWYEDGQFLLNNHSDGIYLLDPKTGEYTQCLAGHRLDDVQGGITFENGNGSLKLAGLDGDPTCYYLALEEGQWLADQSHGFAVLGSYYAAPMSHVLDLRNQLHVADIAFPEGSYGSFAAFLDNGSLLLVALNDRENTAYLYDTSAPVADSAPIYAYECTPEELETETARIAQGIFDATGIEILYGSRGNDFVLYDYVGVAELEPFKVFGAVSTVAEILYQYPEGMLREAWDVGYEGLRIYLCGSIYGVYSGGLDMAGGLTSQTDNYIIVAVDINNPIESVLPHEMSHVFDYRINSLWEMDWMAVWESIHPFSDAYIYSYDDYYMYAKYTPAGESNPSKVWFVDSYGRTFPTEDRAKIMEVLFGSGETPDPRLEYPHILEKARLYCYILRQCFPSCNGEEAPFWERFLGVIDESVLP